jgi:hypothetical protein
MNPNDDDTIRENDSFVEKPMMETEPKAPVKYIDDFTDSESNDEPVEV